MISPDTTRRVKLSVETMQAIRASVRQDINPVGDGEFDKLVDNAIQVYCAMLIAETTR